MTDKQLDTLDPKLASALKKETERQIEGLEMIASENYTSRAVMALQGSILTNKYAEGYPGKRYYGGCEFVDEVETLAIDRAKELFQAEAANVQPHSGSSANFAVFLACLKPGEKILGMDLSHGGHLTHGSPVNMSGLLYQAVSYGLHPEKHLLDYDMVLKKALEEKPQLIIAGYSAYPRHLDFQAFRDIANKVGAKLLVDMAHFAGLVASGHHASPVPVADFVTSTTHKTLRGPRGGIILTRAENEKLMNSRIFPGSQGGPLMHVIGGKAVAFKEALMPDFKAYIDQVLRNAKALSEILLEGGLKLVTGGTDNHLLLVDLSEKEITGKEAEKALDLAGITVNKNTVPNEKRSPFVTSGIRIGTPALTTRGMKEPEMKWIGERILMVLENSTRLEVLEKIKSEVRSFAKDFPIP